MEFCWNLVKKQMGMASDPHRKYVLFYDDNRLLRFYGY